MNLIHVRLFVLILFSLLALPSVRAENARDIVVGQSIDLSGPNGSIGRDYVAGITTYFDSVNAAGGVGGRHIRYIVRDDQGKPERATTSVNDLLDNEKAGYLMGGIGSEAVDAALRATSFAHGSQILFAPLSEPSTGSSARVLFWRPGAEQEMRYIFSYFGKLGIRDVGIAWQDTAVNRDLYKVVLGEIARRGMTLSGVAKLSSSNDSIARQAESLAARTPHIVVVVADALSAGVFLKRFRQFAPRTFVAGTSLLNLETLKEIAGSNAMEWTVFSQVVPSPLGKQSLIQIQHSAMMKKFRDEALSSMTLEGFAAAETLVRAIGMESPGERDGLQKLMARKGALDIGGMAIMPSSADRHLSPYLDIALFSRSGGLVF